MNASAVPQPATAHSQADRLLEVSGLSVTIDGRGWAVPAVDDVSFDLHKAEVLGIVGESGSGKSLTALAIMRLIDPPVRISSGRVVLDGTDLLTLSGEEMRRVRGARVSMIFQDPMTSLDETFTVGHQVTEVVRAHRSLPAHEASDLAMEMMGRVGIASPRTRMRAYPHELSGGMRQRIVIATALVLNPKVIIADEPTTALDATTQAQILDLMVELQRTLKMSIILISHDLGVVNEIADRIAVMYAGHLVEIGSRAKVLGDPQHPYTQGLLRSRLSLTSGSDYLSVLDGQVPGLRERPAECRFAPRCRNRIDECTRIMPTLQPTGEDRLLRCFNPSPWTN